MSENSTEQKIDSPTEIKLQHQENELRKQESTQNWCNRDDYFRRAEKNLRHRFRNQNTIEGIYDR